MTYLVIEEPNLEDIFHVLHPVGHGQISQRVSQQQHIGPSPQLLEMPGVLNRTFSFVVDVDQFSFESPKHPLNEHIIRQIHSFSLWNGLQITACDMATYRFIKIHVVGEDFDVGMEDSSLADNLFQNVSYSSREDEQWDAVLLEVVKEELVAFSVEIK